MSGKVKKVQFLAELNDNSLLQLFEEESVNHVPERQVDDIYSEMVIDMIIMLLKAL